MKWEKGGVFYKRGKKLKGKCLLYKWYGEREEEYGQKLRRLVGAIGERSERSGRWELRGHLSNMLKGIIWIFLMISLPW